MDDYERGYRNGWAAAFFEGEGSITATGRNIQISVTQKDPEPLQRFAEIVGHPGKIYWKDGKIWAWRVTGIHQVRSVVSLLIPGLSTRRRSQIDNALEKWGDRPLRGPEATITYQKAQQSQCLNGHALDADNVRLWTDSRGRQHRKCKACAREMEARRRQKRGLRSREERLALGWNVRELMN